MTPGRRKEYVTRAQRRNKERERKPTRNPRVNKKLPSNQRTDGGTDTGTFSLLLPTNQRHINFSATSIHLATASRPETWHIIFPV